MAELTDSQIDAASQRGELAQANEPRAESVRYDRKRGRVVVELTNGCTFAFPPGLAQGLEEARDDHLAAVDPSTGYGLHWEELDVDLSIPGLLSGIFGTRSYMARRAGSTALLPRQRPPGATARRAESAQGKLGPTPLSTCPSPCQNEPWMAALTARKPTSSGRRRSPARPLAPALYLVATPIGNLGDITLRALETLAAADVLACEDTRVTRVLLDRYGIRQRPVAYHEHNAGEAGPRLIAALAGRQERRAGVGCRHAAGFRSRVPAGRTRRWQAGIRVVPIPGASAVLAALTASGLPSDAFLFAGFLPVKDGQRRTGWKSLKPCRRR